MAIEMKTIQTNGAEVTGNGESVACTMPDATEKDGFLEQTTSANPDPEPCTPPSQGTRTSTLAEICSKSRISRERLKLLLIIVVIIVFIAVVFVISLAVCSAIYEDSDGDFDSSLFKVPRSFNGSFRLPNRVFTEGLVTLSSNESKGLAAELQHKLADLYKSSPALGRYFSQAEIQAFRNGSVIADYQLMFLMPEEQQDQLRNVTLSREMVYNVFRQFLYDLESEDSGPMYIEPVSLHMFVRV
uniref:TPA-induced transmembrane protein homolog n=1 Tax=Gasterosteus aculeatus aculeatus TaxID=481459 RepID=UPI0000E3BABF|nr:TPA-induced transmembrane protein homolog [Gasterosteus aculeatus aculeatus]